VGPECFDVGVVECVAEAGREETTGCDGGHSVDCLQEVEVCVGLQVLFEVLEGVLRGYTERNGWEGDVGGLESWLCPGGDGLMERMVMWKLAV